MRKTLTLMAQGNTSLRSLKPIASSLARSSALFQGMENDLMCDTYRWAPPESKTIPTNSPTLYDPSTKLSMNQKWAARWTTEFMKCLHQQHKTDDDDDEGLDEGTLNDHDDVTEITDDITMFGLMLTFTTHASVHLVCDMAARTCELSLLEPTMVRSTTEGPDQQIWMVSSKPMFEPLVNVIASVYDDVVASKTTGVDLDLVELKQSVPDESSSTFRLSYQIVETHHITTLRLRRPRQTSSRNNAGDGDDDTDIDSDDQPDGPGEPADFGDNMADEHPHNHDTDDGLDGLYQELEDELRGDDLDVDEYSQQLGADQQYQDLESMDDINSRFVASVVEKNHDNTLGVAVDIQDGNLRDPGLECQRPFEDETGEELFQGFVKQRLSPQASTAQQSGTSGSPAPSQPSSSLHRIALTDLQVSGGLREWNVAFEKSLEACDTMSESLSRFDTNDFEATLSHDLSLVLHDKCSEDSTDVSYVTWVKPYKKLSGRIISLDDDSCVIYPSHFHDTKRTFTGPIMIVPCVGARVRKQHREPMPTGVIRLQHMFTIALAANTPPDPDDLFTEMGYGRCVCAACHVDDPLLPVRQCALCLCFWHDQCGLNLFQHLNSFRLTTEVKTPADYELSLGDLPFILLPGSQPVRHS